MDVLLNAGTAALGSRLRRLSEKLVAQASQVYKEYGVDMEPSWFPVMYSLMHESPLSVVSIAEKTGQSHPFISKTVGQMKAKGLLESHQSLRDKRVQLLSLSTKGESLSAKLHTQITDIGHALTHQLDRVAPQFMTQLTAVESLLQQHSLIDMIHLFKHSEFSVVPYSQNYQAAFYHLNKSWIENHFTMEASDRASLEDPQGYIINKGGSILLLKGIDNEIYGTVALIPMEDGRVELAKMTISNQFRGKGLGVKLGEAALQEARKLGFKRVFLESNQRLSPAINLYKRLGFKTLSHHCPSPYQRCDIQMELLLE